MRNDPELLAEIAKAVASVKYLTWPSGRAENYG
jgi:hypothetical protein